MFTIFGIDSVVWMTLAMLFVLLGISSHAWNMSRTLRAIEKKLKKQTEN